MKLFIFNGVGLREYEENIDTFYSNYTNYEIWNKEILDKVELNEVFLVIKNREIYCFTSEEDCINSYEFLGKKEGR